jgi:hypothetical protein
MPLNGPRTTPTEAPQTQCNTFDWTPAQVNTPLVHTDSPASSCSTSFSASARIVPTGSASRGRGRGRRHGGVTRSLPQTASLRHAPLPKNRQHSRTPLPPPSLESGEAYSSTPYIVLARADDIGLSNYSQPNNPRLMNRHRTMPANHSHITTPMNQHPYLENPNSHWHSQLDNSMPMNNRSPMRISQQHTPTSPPSPTSSDVFDATAHRDYTGARGKVVFDRSYPSDTQQTSVPVPVPALDINSELLAFSDPRMLDQGLNLGAGFEWKLPQFHSLAVEGDSIPRPRHHRPLHPESYGDEENVVDDMSSYERNLEFWEW